MTLTDLARAGWLWTGAQHGTLSRPFLPIERGAALRRLAEREDRYQAAEERHSLGPVDPIGVDWGSFEAPE